MPILLTLLPLIVALQTGQAKTDHAIYTDPATVHQQTQWSVSPGLNAVLVGDDNLAVIQREPRNTTKFAIAQKGIDVGQSGKWRVSFDIQMGDLGSTPTAVALYAGKQIIGWVGADGYYRVLGTFFGKDFFDKVDNSVFPLADNRWHTISFASTDGETITIQRDSKTVGKTKSFLRPDTIKVGQLHLLFDMAPANLRQAELSMRKLRVEIGD